MAVMIVRCFVAVICVNSGGSVSKFLLWRVNDDYLDFLDGYNSVYDIDTTE